MEQHLLPLHVVQLIAVPDSIVQVMLLMLVTAFAIAQSFNHDRVE